MTEADTRVFWGEWPACGLGGSLPRSAVALVGLLGACLAGCATSARLEARVAQIGTALAGAEAHGAMRCAPRELASAQSQLEFARLELEQGDATVALVHLDLADENVRAAQLLTLPGRCDDPYDGSADSRRSHER